MLLEEIEEKSLENNNNNNKHKNDFNEKKAKNFVIETNGINSIDIIIEDVTAEQKEEEVEDTIVAKEMSAKWMEVSPHVFT